MTPTKNLVNYAVATLLAILIITALSPSAYACKYKDTTPIAIENMIIQHAKNHGLDQNLVWSIAKVESNLNPCAISSAGAMGIMQLMPATAKAYGVTDPLDPDKNIAAATLLIKDLLNKNDIIQFALTEYNAGRAALIKYRKVPPYDETREYIRKIYKVFYRKTGTDLLSYNNRKPTKKS